MRLLGRLQGLPLWRLVVYLVWPVGFSAIWLAFELKAGRMVWAAVFGVLLVVALAVFAAALVVRRRPRSPGR
jgi:uncharacterized membrane protein (DUF485 family)